ncbi:hypothetical protein BDP27DRAFT_1415479 [Rhodocollybia butyracea]|uniref:Uncharacterized protein n=1 Tax=Rhodocollybia butyracea TaxID=206335 RepID=A0A9P5UCG3_9AGAR|nr:hypothetical protein BDP27DRAFT_1415479 [Rhodocollybia butyracea]
MLLSHHYLPFVLLAALISSACAAPTTPPRPKYAVDVIDENGVETANVPASMHTRIAQFILDFPGLTPNGPTQNGHGGGNRDWKKVLQFVDSYRVKVPPTVDDPKEVACFLLKGGKLCLQVYKLIFISILEGLCSGSTSCLGYVVVIEGHSGTAVTVGAVVVRTSNPDGTDTYTVLDHIPPSESKHDDSIKKHQKIFYKFITKFESAKAWARGMTEKNVKISERLGWTPANGATSPSHAASGEAGAAPGKPPHPHPGPHSR